MLGFLWVVLPFIFIDFCIFLGTRASALNFKLPRPQDQSVSAQDKFKFKNAHPRGARGGEANGRPKTNEKRSRPARPGRPSGPRQNWGRTMTVKAEDDGMDGEQPMMAAKDAVEGRDVRGGEAIVIRNLKS